MSRVDDSEGFLTPEEMSALFQVTRQTVTRWARTKDGLAIQTPGFQWRFSRAYVRRWRENPDGE